MSPVVLSSNYYLVNFKELVQFVEATYPDVLSQTEIKWAEDFKKLPENSQRLYIRLLCRTKDLFRASRLDYAEIEDIGVAAEHLGKNNFFDINGPLKLDQLLPLFTRNELFEFFEPELSKSTKRAALDEYMATQMDQSSAVSVLLENDSFYRIRYESVFDTYKLCFFGNLYQDMTEFVLRDLGLTEYEKYTIDAGTRVFQHRQQLELHMQYYQCANQLDEVLGGMPEDILNLHSELPSLKTADVHLKRRVERLSNKLARQLERLEDLEGALCLYQTSTRAPSRERQTRILLKQTRATQALELCESILARPETEEEREFALIFGSKIAKSLAQEWPLVPRFKPDNKTLVLPKSELSVELSAVEYFNAKGLCFYVENTLFNGIFGLVFWDIVFAPLEGMFFNPFQSSPADFYEGSFYQNRKAIIDQRLRELEVKGAIDRFVWSSYKRKKSLQNPLVSWRYLDEVIIRLALDRIPLEHWLLMFRRLLRDLKQNRTGFPDLIHFPESGSYQLIEVKGPGDTLQKNQIRWMRFFKEHNINCVVAQVQWAEAEITER